MSIEGIACSGEFEALRRQFLATTDADERLLLLERMCGLLSELHTVLRAQLSRFPN